jgi:hypothetical protein
MQNKTACHNIYTKKCYYVSEIHCKLALLT